MKKYNKKCFRKILTEEEFQLLVYLHLFIKGYSESNDYFLECIPSKYRLLIYEILESYSDKINLNDIYV